MIGAVCLALFFASTAHGQALKDEDDPVVEQTSGLATRVRTTIDLSENGNGRVH